ncbi:ABC transporter permease [Aestuariimicrobium sp. Y1814]|uniref:ABC transporter permease n=1 Tax=Aestuariimicrobium sp. Y1814 TaxID=3418742 RepID=UPI003DA71B60
MNYLAEAFAWLASPTNWTGPLGAGALLAEHLWYSLVGLALSALVAIPVGCWVGHTGRGRGLAVALSGGARALPTLGLVTLFGLLLGIGLTAPMLAFVILGIPSVLAGTYAGLQGVDRAVVDGARAAGMTEWQVLTQVELPLGMPVLLGGLRAALLQIIATATLAAYVGAGGLGRLLFLGLKTQQYDVMLASSLLVIGLALISEVVFLTLQRMATPAHVITRKEPS